MIKHVALITFCWSISPCISWHAFLGKIACPEISGTAITTRLKLPSLPVTNCSIAATSLNQAVLVYYSTDIEKQFKILIIPFRPVMVEFQIAAISLASKAGTQHFEIFLVFV
jgi:hypothetical protein